MQSTSNGFATHAEAFTIPVKSIILGDNARKTFDPASILRLARNIEAVGLLQPLVVVLAPGGRYTLRAGFRRLRALQALKWVNIPVRVVEKDGPLMAAAQNIAENTSREEIPPFELAQAAYALVVGDDKNPSKMTRKEAAIYFGVHEKHLNNLIRCMDRCSPVVLAAWKKMPNNIPVGAVVAWAPLDHDAQEKKLEEFLGGSKADRKILKMSKRGRSGAVKKDILVMADKWSDKPGKFAEGVAAALRWALGETKGIKG
jgi:ParB family chromosome partitioning protein